MTPSTLPSRCRSLLYFLLFALLHIQVARSAGADQWRSRSIYQIVTDRFARGDGSTTAPCDTSAQQYCGGDFAGIISRLDYIQGMGFTAIWISPVIKGIESSPVGAGYHGFWQQDLNTINPHFGTGDDLKALADEVHKRGMYFMIDILANNFAAVGPGSNVDYSQYSAPFNKKSEFHSFCLISNYSDPTNAQNCWLGNDQISLPDVNTELAEVQQFFNDYGTKLAQTYNIDGYRVDAAKHVPKPFWNQMQTALGNYMIGEYFDSDASLVCNTMIDGLDGVLNYPLFNGIQTILGNSALNTSDIQWYLYNLTNNCRDTTLLGTFTENHDVSRFGAWTNDTAVRASALAFAMTNDGIPIVYYGAEQGFSGNQDPENREALWLTGYPTNGVLYRTIKAVNYARNRLVDLAANDTDFTPYWKFKSKLTYFDPNIVAIRKGYSSSLVVVFSNKGSKATAPLGPYMIADTNFGENVEITEVIGCTKQHTYEYGTFTTSLDKGMPQVWIPSSYLTADFKAVCPSVKQVTYPKMKSNDAARAAGYGLGAWGAALFAALMSCMI